MNFQKSAGRLCRVIGLLLFLSSPALAAEKPNIVLFYIDDMGWGEIAPFSHAANQTPNLDRMAAEGLCLRQYYTSNTACSPSRAAMLTGTHAGRIEMDGTVNFPGDNWGLNPSEITIAEMLKEQGYATGCFGKWHLGDQPEFLPLEQGFNRYYGIPYSNDMWPGNTRGHRHTKEPYTPLPVVSQNKPVAYVADAHDQALLAETFTDKAIDWIKEDKESPFFCYVPHAYVHFPRYARKQHFDRAEGEVYRSTTEEVDDSVGRILDTLRELKLDQNSLVIFTSDNGGVGSPAAMGPLRGNKGGPKYEGHQREPMVVWWPGTVPAGAESDAIMASTDFMPSLAKLVGGKVPTDRRIDGKDALDVLLGKPGAKSPHKVLHYEEMGVRRGDWKLVRNGKDAKLELYDLSTDLSETTNLASEKPELTRELLALCEAHAADLVDPEYFRPRAVLDRPTVPLIPYQHDLPNLRTYLGAPATETFNAAGESVPEGGFGGGKQVGLTPKAKPKAKPKPVTQPTPPQVAHGEKPDILFIAIDDMNDWTSLFDDANPIQTPNLKRLAARGTFFSRAYCASAGCNPSRTAIMTGLRPTTSGVYSNGQAWRDKIPDSVSLPEYLAQHGGYVTRGAGKIYHHGRTGAEPEGRPSFQEFFKKLAIRGPGKNKNYNGYRIEDKTPLSGVGFDWGVHDQKMIDVDMCEWVEARLQEKQESPLFLAAGIFNPHLPFYADAATFERYPMDKVSLPPMPENDLDDVGQVGIKMTDKEPFVYDQTTAAEPGSPGSLKRMVQCYQAAADYADQMVGRLLDKLDATGRAENTIIVLWSDHGYHLGDKQCGVKFTLWEKATHVPFIIVAPGIGEPGSVCGTPVGLVDIYPTLVELAGLPPKANNDGLSLVPLLEDPEAEWSRPTLTTEGPGNHAIRTRDFRYIRYHNGFEELYADADPWNHHNLAKDEGYAEILAEHRKHLPRTEAHAIPARYQTIDPDAWKAKPKDTKPAKANPPASAKRPAPKPASGRPARIEITPASYQPAPDDVLLADFEADDYGDWKVTGNAFGEKPAEAKTHRNRIAYFLGKGLVNTYLDGDKSTGTLASPPFAIERKHLNFLIGGGKNPGENALNLIVDGRTVRTATGYSLKNSANEELMDWQSWDVSELNGKTATLEIVDNRTSGWGHINVDHIFLSNQPMPSASPRQAAAPPKPPGPEPSPLAPGQFDPAHRTFASYGDVGYDQKLRPQFHFSSRKNWINDPNGMVYYDGEWHLYFQHCATSVNRGPKSWGHAVSTDLVHWEQLPHAIVPYDLGAIWSGTAVVDHNNSLGKQVGSTKALAAFFTTTVKGGFIQAMAYSTDKGRTYTLHNKGRAVVPNQEVSPGERDPKVFWDEANQKWKMILILGGKERIIRIFESDNLTDWVKAGDINRKWAAECIDLFQLPVDGDTNNQKWVVADASFDYEVGQFTGNGFETEGPTLRGDYGKGFYAAQTFNNGPDGRVVQIGWMNDRRLECPFLVEGMPFNQQMAFPTDLTLRTTPEGIRLFRWPVPEIDKLYEKSHAFENITAEAATEALAKVKPELADLSIEFEPGKNGRLNLTVRGIEISYGDLIKYRNAAREMTEVKSFTFNGKSCPAPMIDGKVKLRILADRVSVELYANGGSAVASSYEFDIPSGLDLKFESTDTVKINSLEVNELKSAWPSK